MRGWLAGSLCAANQKMAHHTKPLKPVRLSAREGIAIPMNVKQELCKLQQMNIQIDLFVKNASARESLTRHVEDHGPSAVDARLAEETRHRVVGDGGGGDGGVDRAESKVGRIRISF